MYLQFRNPGLMDELVFKSFGVSVKENENPIGFFGTGLKYAIAVILRKGGKIYISSGNEQYVFSKKNQIVRGKEFEYVCCNGELLGYTIDLGKQWELWMAYRELYSNCKDENGIVSTVKKQTKETGEYTSIYVDCQEMVNLHISNNPKIFLDTIPLYVNEHIAVHPGTSKHLYYKGIRVYDLQRSSKFTYNILSPIDLTEDRTIKYYWDAARKITRGIINIGDKSIFDRMFKDPMSFEYDVDFEHSEIYYSQKFIDMSIESFKSDPNSIPPSLYNCIIKFNKDINKFTAAELDNREKIKLNKALEFCKQIDFDPSEYKITIVRTLGNNVLAMALRDQNQIILSKTLFDMGLKQLIAAIVEEVVHLRDLHNDCTRSMQNYLFDKIVTLGEKYTGECL